MKKTRFLFSYFLLGTLVFYLFLPLHSAYAFSAQELLATASTSSKTSQTSIMDLLLGLILGKFLGQGLPTAVSGGSGSITSGKELIGFYAEWYGQDQSSYQDFLKYKSQIRTIAPFWATLDARGNLTNRGGDDHAAVVDLAHRNQRQVLLLVNNAKNEQGTAPIDTMLQDQAARAQAIKNIADYLKKYHLDGVNIDFEGISAERKKDLTAFMAELNRELKSQGYIISMDVFPKESENNDVAAVYDYAALAAYTDKIVLMTYDHHGTWSDAGAIADLSWVNRCVEYALNFIPKTKLYLGLAGYGYDWSAKGVTSLEYGQVSNLQQKYQADVLWDEATKSAHFSYQEKDGTSHQVWFENSRSLAYKLDLVNQYDLSGAALWKLGEEDPAFWPELQKKWTQ